MVFKFLTEVKSEEKGYFERFDELFVSTNLTEEQIKALAAKKTIVGHLTRKEDCSAVSLEKLSGLKYEPKLVKVITNHLNGLYSLSIIKRSDAMKIFQEKNTSLFSVFCFPSREIEHSNFVEIPGYFREDTLKLLPSQYRNRFSCLKD